MRKIDANKFIDDCKSGDTQKVSDFINKFYSPATILSVILSGFDSDELRGYAANLGFKFVCENNHVDCLKVMFSNREFQNHVDMERDYATYFRSACYNGNTEIVRFLLEDKSVIARPDVNAGNPVINKLNSLPDYAAQSMFGTGTPLSLAASRSHNDIIELLLNKSIHRQEVHEVTIEKAFIVCLKNGNVDGARIIKDNSNVLKTIVKDYKGQSDQYDNGSLSEELYLSIVEGRKEVESFLVNECKVGFNDTLKAYNREIYDFLNAYFLKNELESSLETNQKKAKKIKI